MEQYRTSSQNYVTRRKFLSAIGAVLGATVLSPLEAIAQTGKEVIARGDSLKNAYELKRQINELKTGQTEGKYKEIYSKLRNIATKAQLDYSKSHDEADSAIELVALMYAGFASIGAASRGRNAEQHLTNAKNAYELAQTIRTAFDYDLSNITKVRLSRDDSIKVAQIDFIKAQLKEVNSKLQLYKPTVTFKKF